MKTFGESLREHAMQMFNFKNKNGAINKIVARII